MMRCEKERNEQKKIKMNDFCKMKRNNSFATSFTHTNTDNLRQSLLLSSPSVVAFFHNNLKSQTHRKRHTQEKKILACKNCANKKEDTNHFLFYYHHHCRHFFSLFFLLLHIHNEHTVSNSHSQVYLTFFALIVGSKN